MPPTDLPPNSDDSPLPDRADIERAKSVVRAALAVLAEDKADEPSGGFTVFGKVVDYINDRWVMFAFIVTVAIVLIPSHLREDFSLFYFVEEVAFKQTELDFKKTEFDYKAKQFHLERGKKRFESEQAKDRVTYAHSLLDVGRYAAAAKVFEEAIKLDSTNQNAVAAS